jgi:hypothetical protein
LAAQDRAAAVLLSNELRRAGREGTPEERAAAYEAAAKVLRDEQDPAADTLLAAQRAAAAILLESGMKIRDERQASLAPRKSRP